MTIGAEMRVGSVAESVTVTGESPVVDIQTARQQMVIDGDVVRALPASRSYGNYIAALPAIQATGFGSGAATINNFFSARGGRSTRRPHPARRDERGRARKWRRRVRLLVRHVELLGSAGGHLRRPRRGRPRRPGLQHHPEDRRQYVQRDRLYQLCRQVGAVEQHRRLPPLAGIQRAAGAHQELRRQHRRGRTNSARPRVVLRQHARHRHLPGTAEPVRQPERREP